MKLSIEMYIILVAVITFLGGVAGFLIRKRFSEARIVSAKEVARRLIEEAEKRFPRQELFRPRRLPDA